MAEASAPTNPSAEESSKPKKAEPDEKPSFADRINKLECGIKGTYLSFFLLISAMVASIIAQNYVQDHLTSNSWTSNCPNGYDKTCKGNSAVYRFSFALVLLFIIQFIGTTIYVPFFDMLWIWKIVVFVGVVIGFYNTDSRVFDDNGYAWFARFAAFFYVILQQVILIDFAYNVNEKFLAYAEADGGNFWYGVVLVSAIFMYCGSFSAIGVMFWQFLGCDSNAVILSLTIILSVGSTLIQIFASDNGSILTSAIMTCYATYICYSSVTLNPDGQCNPTISTSYQSISTAIGLALTVVSVSWATYTAVKKIPGSIANKPTPLPTTTTDAPDIPSLRVVLQEVAVVFVLVSTYYAMVLTNWATLQSNSSIGNPRNGEVAMWLQAAAQWTAIILYCWTLIAPKLFPDRDFGN